MCTVSFVSAGEKKIITSNRDEHVGRQAAYAPSTETICGQRITFPKDPKAGGTWFSVSENGTIAVLLNGAFVKHQPIPPYRRSRGLVLLDLISSEDPLHAFKQIDLDRIEPFTVVLYCRKKLHELRWDGTKKHLAEPDPSGNHIWSSSTLYNEEVVSYRRQLFDTFISNTAEPGPVDVHTFHASNNDDEENGFVINRRTGLRTFSITQAIWSNERIDFKHSDLLQDNMFEHTILIAHSLVTP